MLWDEIYNFFVTYVFGGVDINGEAHITYFGNVFAFDNGSWDDSLTPFTNNVGVKLNDFVLNNEYYTEGNLTYYMSFGNYLSLIATIIIIVAILLFCVFIIKKIIGIIFRLFTGSSAF